MFLETLKAVRIIVSLCTPPTLTLAPALVPGSVAELQVDLPVLPGLCPALAVAGGFVRLVIDLRTEGVGELLAAAAALLAEEVLLAEVFPKVFVIAGKRKSPSCAFPICFTNGTGLLSQDKGRIGLGDASFNPTQTFQLSPLTCRDLSARPQLWN